MARRGILGALFFAQSVVDLFSVEQEIELAIFALAVRAAQKRGQMTVGIVARRPLRAASNMSFGCLSVFSLYSMCRITHSILTINPQAGTAAWAVHPSTVSRSVRKI